MTKRNRSVYFLLIPLLSSFSFAITRVNTLHQYTAASGTPYSLGTVTAGNLIVCGVSSGNNGSVSISDTVNGGGYTQLPQLIFDTNFSLDVFYILSTAGGSNSVTITTSNSDNGLSCAEYSGNGPWSLDTSTSVAGNTQAATASPRAPAVTTSGSNDVFYMYFADETAGWTGSCGGSPCPTGSFSNINWDNTHIDAQAEWLNAPAQTNLSAGWDATSAASTHWAIYIAAFKETSQSSSVPGSVRTTPGIGSIRTTAGSGSIRSK